MAILPSIYLLLTNQLLLIGINMFLSHSVLPLITLPTRVTDDSATLIHHVFMNDIKHTVVLNRSNTNPRY